MSSDKPTDLTEKEMGAPSSVSESDTGDGEFEPTAEMLVDDFDDERTLAEEELMETGENQAEEVDNLTKEQNMPIEELLAIYGSGSMGAPQNSPSDEDVEENGEPAESMDVEEAENDSMHAEEASRSSNSDSSINGPEKVHMDRVKMDKKKSDLSNLYPELDTNGDSGGNASARSLRSCSRHPSEDEYDDEEGSGEEEEDWRKTIMIGSSYQAQVPEGLQNYGPTPPYENDDKLLWEPEEISPDEVEKYLSVVGVKPTELKGVEAIPMGAHTRDNEQALHLLLQCGYSVEEALRRFRMNPGKVASCMTLWSEEECRNFENGLKLFGKEFHLIQQNKVRTRSVGELVQFYYLWKKTERHDLFVTKTRIEKKKYFVHPGTTDYMDRFLDDGEGSNLGGGGAPTAARGDARSDSPGGMHALLYGNCPRGVQLPMAPTTVSTTTMAFGSSNAAAHHDHSVTLGGANAHSDPPTTTTVPPIVTLSSSRQPPPSGDGASPRTLSAYISRPSLSAEHATSRGIKRPCSPSGGGVGGVGVNVSIAHSLGVRGGAGSASAITIDPLGKAGAVAL